MRKISIPQGGEYALEYEWEQGTTDMPQSRYVLPEVTRKGRCRFGKQRFQKTVFLKMQPFPR